MSTVLPERLLYIDPYCPDISFNDLVSELRKKRKQASSPSWIVETHAGYLLRVESFSCDWSVRAQMVRAPALSSLAEVMTVKESSWISFPGSVYRGELDLIKHCNESNKITLTSVDTAQCLHNSLLARHRYIKQIGHSFSNHTHLDISQLVCCRAFPPTNTTCCSIETNT